MSGGEWKDLMKVAGQGNAKITRFHLEAGVDPNFQHPEYFTCPIFDAIRNGHEEIVRILVEEGNADPTVIEELSNDSAVEVAIQQGQHDIADYLVSKFPSDYTYGRPRNVLVTGGNRGIGKAICELLLRQGHNVVFTCRCEKSGSQVVDELKNATKNKKIAFIVGDLSSIASTKALAEGIKNEFPIVNGLIHNAGIWPTEKVLNEDGLEMGFMVNYMAPYILTNSLHSLLEQNGPSRIVLVNAGLYKFGTPDIAKTPFGQDFHRFKTYMNTKNCGILFLQQYARKIQGSKVSINAVHPGVIKTGLGESTEGNQQQPFLGCLLRVLKLFWSSPAVGAAAPVWLAVHSDAERLHGQFYDGMKKDEFHPSVTKFQLQDDWQKWTEDFLNRKDTK